MRANYRRAVKMALQTLQDANISQLPIDLNQILQSLHRTVQLYPYSRMMAAFGADCASISEFLESELGACAYEPQTERYLIYYNDTKNNDGLDRFTIAHEIGHIVLEHHRKAKTTTLQESALPPAVYRVFENEANCFARNLLAPIPLVDQITDDVAHPSSVHDLMEAFFISFTAAGTRRSFVDRDLQLCSRDAWAYFATYEIGYGFACHVCANMEVEPGDTYCKICGNQWPTFVRTWNRKHYAGWMTDAKLRLVQCPTCGNGIFSAHAKFCKLCGTHLFNICEGKVEVDRRGSVVGFTQHTNDGNARYCRTCGAKTEFYCRGFLKPWIGQAHSQYPEIQPLDARVAETKQSERATNREVRP